MSSTEKIPMRHIFSQRLKQLRMEKGLKGSEMAVFLGVSQPVYSRYENGRIPELNVVSAISEKCNVSVDWLLGQSEKDPPTKFFQPEPGRSDHRHKEIDELNAHLKDLKSELDDIRKLLVSLLAEERCRNAQPPPLTEPKKNEEKAG
jgi:transcriptional regulator with XRE-family HTH domain